MNSPSRPTACTTGGSSGQDDQALRQAVSIDPLSVAQTPWTRTRAGSAHTNPSPPRREPDCLSIPDGGVTAKGRGRRTTNSTQDSPAQGVGFARLFELQLGARPPNAGIALSRFATKVALRLFLLGHKLETRSVLFLRIA